MLLTPQTKAKVELYKRGHFDSLGLNPKQVEALKVLHFSNRDKKVVTYGGGAGGGKSWVIVYDSVMKSLAYAGVKGFWARNELTRLMKSTYMTFMKLAPILGLKEGEHFKLNGKTNIITFANGSMIELLDISYQPRDPLYERFGSLEYTYGAIEEAGEVDFDAFDTLKTRVGRWLNKEYNLFPKLLNTANPKKNWLYKYFYLPWKQESLDPEDYFIQALVSDNPHLDEEYIKSLHKIKNKAKKERLLYGNWEYDDDPAQLVEFDKIIDLYTNTHVPRGNKYITGDIATSGADLFVLMVWDGLRVVHIHTEEKSNGKGIIDKMLELKNKFGVPNSNIIYDADGSGSSLGGWIANAVEFKNGSKAKHGENYNHLKSQCYFKLADYINEGKIWIVDDVHEERLKAELEHVKENNYQKDGKRSVIPKQDVKDKLGRSPDFSDTLMMRMYYELTAKLQGFNADFY